MPDGDIEDSYTLSPTQRGMLFRELSAPRSGVDLGQLVGTIRETLNIDAFRLAWQGVARRHPVFRTAFRWEGLREPMQDVYQAVELPFRSEDWRGVPPAAQTERLAQFLEEDRRAGFDPRTPPITRVAVFRMAEDDYRCVWTFHHLVLDGPSVAIALLDLFAIYEASLRGEDEDPPMPRPFRDYIEWISRHDGSGDERYWRALLAGFKVPTSTPRTLGRPSAPGVRGPRRAAETRLSAASTAALRAFTERHRLTLAAVLQGAWALLLSRYTGEEDVVFGLARSARETVDGAAPIVGVFMNTLPVRTAVKPDLALVPWLEALRTQTVRTRDHEHTPLADVQRWCDLPEGQSLFESTLVLDRARLDTVLRAHGESWANREFELLDDSGYPLTLTGYMESELCLELSYDQDRLDNGAADRLLDHLATLLLAMARGEARTLKELPLLTEAERHRQLVEWNATAKNLPAICIHRFIEQQAARTPDTVAVIFENRELTYREVNSRANALARRLQGLGVGPEVLVGICATRSLEMVVALLGVLKAGGAYVPLDPSYPKERLAFMLRDAAPRVLLTQQQLMANLPPYDGPILSLEGVTRATGDEPNLESGVTPEHLAYVIYTSGSTGKPKGVMVEHRQVANFFAAMDERIGPEPGGVWLAVTSVSFDISVLELLWTLARGFRVVVHADPRPDSAPSTASSPAIHDLEFSLCYFASDAGDGHDAYHLLREGVRFADRHGFAAVWTPERHFHAFGGPFPNPAVTSAAIAAITERVRIRAGSVVLPLHDPIRVVEEWAVVDNLSEGRVGISFASGWHPEDFVLAPERYADRKERMYRDIDTVRRLWRGETISAPGPLETTVQVRTLPRPRQGELPVWITSAGSRETFERAGAMGVNVLTHLLGQTIEELRDKIAAYRAAWSREGHGPGRGHVTLMAHTFVGDDDASVREIVRTPMINYLRSSVSLIKGFSGMWTARRRAALGATAAGDEFQRLSPPDLEDLLGFAFDRYFETGGLFGSPATCLQMVDALRQVGVDEIACLIDFGVDPERVLKHLDHLDRVKMEASRGVAPTDYALPAQIRRHGVTHLQCTPSAARMLLAESETRRALAGLKTLLVGGESLPASLAAELRAAVPGVVLNMYGPTETTVWSSTHRVEQEPDTVPIGRPIANTTFYVVDRDLQPVPVGVSGELFIGGAGVARGYLRRPDLTAERFVPNPFVDDPGARLYRTGDIVCWREDGTLEYQGRLDDQVKVRGHRIELGEIETVLSQHPGVRAAAVTARSDTAAGDVMLVAYVVPRTAAPSTPGELRAYLAERLPAVMVPSVYVTVAALPLTPSRKIDRGALPPPERFDTRPNLGGISPRTPVETSLAAIWSEVLGVETVGAHDSFFELGGSSLTTIQIAFRIRETFHVELPLRAIFTAPTLAALATAIEERLVDQAAETDLASLYAEIETLSDQEARALGASDLANDGVDR